VVYLSRLTQHAFIDMSKRPSKRLFEADTKGGQDRLVLPATPLVRSVMLKVSSVYPDLKVDERKGEVSVGLANVDDESLGRVLLDLVFLERNPDLAIENVCCNISNYTPHNESQEEMLGFVRRLIAYQGPRPVGLYLHGDPGTGKTHLCVGIAKELLVKEFQPVFASLESLKRMDADVKPGQTWILDDMNCGYSVAGDRMKEIVIAVHKVAGKLFITSNKPYDTLVEELFPRYGNQAEKIRFDDRTKGMFKVLHIVGTSQRASDAWYL
jgi:hypothetical protein